jgi:purine nucleosidase|tara:strand:+ start:2919 stop:3962 length:1044 start_codon:yes stop_codon:yes gene_type:complete
MTAIPFVLDTDIGTDVDDALALILALASPELDLVGVTIVDGDVDTRARIAARLLGMAGRPDIPVIKGVSKPINAGRGPTWFGHEGKGLLDLPWDGPEAKVLSDFAPDWIVEISKKREVQLCAVGPFSNVAAAVILDPTLPKRLPKLAVMGGMVFPEHYEPQWQDFFKSTGLPPNHLDHNSNSDVHAAYIMANAGFDMTWVTAELTFCTTMNCDTMERFRSTNTLLGDRLARMLEIWAADYFHRIPKFQTKAKPFPEDAVAALHDPLAIVSQFGGEGLTLKPISLEFAEAGERFETKLVNSPGALSEHQAGDATHLVSVAVNHKAFASFFEERVMDFLSGLKKTRFNN